MPTFPWPPAVWICELTPITSPRASSSGPPELPWFSAASVWMTWSIVKPFGAVSGRCSALTIPAVIERSRPNGLPMATTGSPTWIRSELPSTSGVSARERASIFSTATSLDGSTPTTLAFMLSLFEKLTWTDFVPATTCSFVMMWPALSITKPEPSAFSV